MLRCYTNKDIYKYIYVYIIYQIGLINQYDSNHQFLILPLARLEP